MRKIFYSVIGLVTVFLFYSILDTSSWWYNNTPTTARIDISEKTENDAPCFEVKDKETGENLKTADWMAKWGNQGYVVQKEGTNQDLEINVLKDNCKIDFALRGPWELKDPNDREKGLIEHWVEYTGFAINGEDVIVEPVATWHNKPFNYSITANIGDVINVGLKWRKHYMEEELQHKNLLDSLIFLSVLLLSLLMWYLSRFSWMQRILRPLYNFKRRILNYTGGGIDLEEIIVKWWNSISPLSKKSFLWIFLITNIVFLFHTTQWLWGDHDFGRINRFLRLGERIFEQRFSVGLIEQIFGGDLLPVINNVFCFAGFTLGVIYLAKYWKIPQTFLCYTLFGLFIILMPYTCVWLWYIHLTSYYWNICFVVLGLKLSLDKSYIKSLFAIFLFVISLGGYAALFSTILIVFLGRVLLDIMLENKTIKELIRAYLRTGINIIISVAIFKLILVYYNNLGRINNNFYNSSYIAINELPEKIKNVFVLIKEMFYVSQPFISTGYKILISLPIVFVVYRLTCIKPIKIVQCICVISAILLSSQISNLVAKHNFFHFMRIDFFSLPYIWALFIAIGLKGKSLSKSFNIVVLISALWLNILSDTFCCTSLFTL